MTTVALLLLIGGIYLLNSAFKNRRPLETLRQVAEKPGSIRSVLRDAEGYEPVYPSAVQGASGVAGTGEAGDPTLMGGSGTVAKAISFARAQIGKPYIWGATGLRGYDCSGLCYRSYKEAGLIIPRTTATQLASGKLRRIKRSELQAGDLLYPFPGHVQLYIGDNRVIEAPGRGRNVRLKVANQFWQGRRIKALEGGRAI